MLIEDFNDDVTLIDWIVGNGQVSIEYSMRSGGEVKRKVWVWWSIDTFVSSRFINDQSDSIVFIMREKKKESKIDKLININEKINSNGSSLEKRKSKWRLNWYLKSNMQMLNVSTSFSFSLVMVV